MIKTMTIRKMITEGVIIYDQKEDGEIDQVKSTVTLLWYVLASSQLQNI